MMQKNSMVETQSLNQRNTITKSTKQKRYATEKTQSQKTPKKQGQDNGMQFQTPNTTQQKKNPERNNIISTTNITQQQNNNMQQ